MTHWSRHVQMLNWIEIHQDEYRHLAASAEQLL